MKGIVYDGGMPSRTPMFIGVFFMAKIITSLDNFISYVNTLYNFSSSAPSSGEEDYTVWTALANTAINIWEQDRGILWRELFGKLQDAADGDKTTAADDYSYACPTGFRFPAGGLVWIGSGTSKTAYQVIKAQDLQLYENSLDRFCYFLYDSTPSLELNPNLTITGGYNINYSYYKYATKLTSGSDSFEMADPMFAVYFALSELKKEEGNQAEIMMMNEKLKGMEDLNEMPTWLEEYNLINRTEPGFNV